MGRRGGEERSEIDQVDADSFEVTEALFDTCEVTTEPLPCADVGIVRERGIPSFWDRPRRCDSLFTRRGVSIDEDLVADRVVEPRWRRVVRRDLEIAGIGHIAKGQASLVHPRIPRGAALEQKPVGGDGIVQRQVCDPPRHTIGNRGVGVDSGLGHQWFGVGSRTHAHSCGSTCRRNSQPNLHGAAERAWTGAGVHLRAVVMRLIGESHAGRDHSLTAPDVSPETMNRCRNRNRMTTGIAPINAPAANGPHRLSKPART